MTIPFYAQAISSLRPGCLWRLVGDDDTENLEWNNENEFPPPTQEEIVEEAQRLQQQYELNEYQRLREKKYPSIIDQLDLLYHQGYEGWKSEIQKVKDQYPKP